MTNYLRIEDFDINLGMIPRDVIDLSNSLSKIRETKLRHRYPSGQDFIIILYHLTFVEKLEKREIAQILGLQPVNVHEHLYRFGWHYSTDYTENKNLSEKEFAKLRTDLAEAKKQSSLLNEIEHPRLKKALEKANNIQESTCFALGFATSEEYIRTIYYLIFISARHFTPKNFVRLFNISIGEAHRRLRYLGFNLSHGEGIKIKKEQGTQNYPVSLTRGKITTAKSQLKHNSPGSSNENYFRVQLSNMIYQYLDFERYDVIVGVSRTGILGSKEIDIPIMVYDISKNQVYRFAIEYNGDFYHTDERDASKKALAESRGWHYLEVIENSSNQYSNNSRLVDIKVRGICEEIKILILNKCIGHE